MPFIQFFKGFFFSFINSHKLERWKIFCCILPCRHTVLLNFKSTLYISLMFSLVFSLLLKACSNNKINLAISINDCFAIFLDSLYFLICIWTIPIRLSEDLSSFISF